MRDVGRPTTAHLHHRVRIAGQAARDAELLACPFPLGCLPVLLQPFLQFRQPQFLHFGIGLPDPEAVRALRDRFVADGVPIAEEWEEPEYVSVKCRDPDGYVVEAAWELHRA